MASTNRTIRRLAARAGLDPEFALLLLREAGLPFAKTSDHVSARRLHQVEAELGLITLRSHAVAAHHPAPPSEPETIAQTTPLAPPRPLKAQRDQMPLVGRRQALDHLTGHEVERIHWVLVGDFARSRDPIEPPGVKSQALLESALGRPKTGLGQDFKYPTAPMAAAALMHSLIHNHPFHNGNKRTALVSTLVFLDKNEWRLHAEQNELYDFVLDLGAHKLNGASGITRQGLADAEALEAAKWLHQRIRQIRHRDHRMKCRHLRSVLLRHGCTLEPAHRGNRMNVARGARHTQIWWGGDGHDVRDGMIPKLREDLELDALHGVDDDMFYDAETALPQFIATYRKTLDRLAKV